MVLDTILRTDRYTHEDMNHPEPEGAWDDGFSLKDIEAWERGQLLRKRLARHVGSL